MKVSHVSIPLYLIFQLLFSHLIAQDFDYYKPVLCKGLLPKEMTMKSSEKYQAEIIQEEKEKRQSDQKAKNGFLLYQRFFIDQLLKSGKVVINEDLTNYLDGILDILLKNEPEVRSKVHVYILRSPSVNALSMNDGTILICWGLLAQLDNEAQLAYILSHEITHFKERHVLNQFQEDRKTEEKRKAKRKKLLDDWEKNNDAKEEKIVSAYSYAQDLEYEADKLGLNRFLTTGYSTDAPEETFNKLKYAYLPFDNLPLNKEFFNCPIPDKYFLTKVSPIVGVDENEDDSRSSHPNLANRKKLINESLKSISSKGEPFLISAEKFLNLRKIARFELPQAYLHYKLYKEAFYNAYLLLEDEPNSYYLKTIIAKALNGIVKEKKGSESQDILSQEGDRTRNNGVQGEIQQVYHLFEKMPKKELNLLALHYIWQLHKKYNESDEVKSLVGEMFQEMVNEHYETSKSLELTEEDQTLETAWAKKQINPYLADTSFTNYFDFCLKEKQDNSNWEKKNENNKYTTKLLKEQNRRGARLGIDKIVLVNPRFHFGSENPQKDMGLITTEKGNTLLVPKVEKAIKASPLEVDLLSIETLKTEDAEKLNDITLLSEWASEQAQCNSLGIGSQQGSIDAIAKKYDTRYFLWLDVVEYKGFNSAHRTSPSGIVLMLFTPLIIPPLLEAWIGKNKITLIYATLYDVKTGRSYSLKRKIFNKKASEMIITSQLYDAFAQIKAKPKTKSK